MCTCIIGPCLFDSNCSFLVFVYYFCSVFSFIFLQPTGLHEHYFSYFCFFFCKMTVGIWYHWFFLVFVCTHMLMLTCWICSLFPFCLLSLFLFNYYLCCLYLLVVAVFSSRALVRKHVQLFCILKLRFCRLSVLYLISPFFLFCLLFMIHSKKNGRATRTFN